MSIIQGKEKIVNPLQQSGLNKKGLCDYVINIASGCLHGCTFCYVPSTPAIRTRQPELKEKGVNDPQLEWGKYLFIRENIPEILETNLRRKTTWRETPEGKGVVMLCSGTDPYQNKQTAEITRETVKILLKYNKRIRILTRSPLWVKDIDLLKHPNVKIGMSLPYLDDNLSRQIEPQAPLPSDRYKALVQGAEFGCNLYVAMAPTPPTMTPDDFQKLLEKVLIIKPQVIFWEPINARGSNGKRMLAAGLDFAQSVMTKKSWAENFIKQWEILDKVATELGCQNLIHVWPDPELKGFIDYAKIQEWLYKPTVETWGVLPQKQAKKASPNSPSEKRTKDKIIV